MVLFVTILGFTKSHLIIHWYDPTSNIVKHANAIYFDEYNTPLTVEDKLSHGASILFGNTTPPLGLTSSVDITDLPHLGTTPFTIQLTIPCQGSSVGCQITTDTYNKLPYICSFIPDSPLATSSLLHGRSNSSFWM